MTTPIATPDPTPLAPDFRERQNLPRWTPDKKDFYEVYFCKWYDVERRQVGWVRYIVVNSSTIAPEVTVWAALIDRDHPENNVAIKQHFPLSAWEADPARFNLRVGACGMTQGRAWGDITSGETCISWDLRAADEGHMVEHFPKLLRHGPFPATKFAAPYCWFKLDGTMTINGRTIALRRARANQAHFWGPKQVEGWHWANCSTFEEDSEFYFEMVVGIMGARLPRMTCLFFYMDGRLHEFNDLLPAFFGYKSENDFETWRFEATRGDLRFRGEMRSDPADMIVYQHLDPDGGIRHGHVNYTADCVIHVERRTSAGWTVVKTVTANKSCTFEVGGADQDPRTTWLIR